MIGVVYVIFFICLPNYDFLSVDNIDAFRELTGTACASYDSPVKTVHIARVILKVDGWSGNACSGVIEYHVVDFGTAIGFGVEIATIRIDINTIGCTCLDECTISFLVSEIRIRRIA
jgi:hypothetical protein